MRVTSRMFSATTFLFALALNMALPPSIAAQQTFALRGTVVTPAGPMPHATVLIEGNTIKAVGQELKIPVGVPAIDTEGTIYPGLIDLHDHVTWNVLPRWRSGSRSGARYDWQQLPEYLMALNLPHQKLVAEGHGCAAERYAEVKALVGGATSQAGLYPDDLTMPGQAHASTAIPAGCLAGLTRELGVASRLYTRGDAEKLRYEVFPLVLESSRSGALVAGLKDGSVHSALFHIAEGAPDNASARREFAMLEARGLLVSGVSIIHGVALSLENFAAMAKVGVGLIWSPRSNFELYGGTADVAVAKAAGVKIALAPDWSPTGSDGMLQELNYAAVWNATQASPPFSDRDLFEMTTRNAAQLGGVAEITGAIAPGMRADLLVLGPDASAEDPYSQIVHASPASVALVVVDGLAVYGVPRLMRLLQPGPPTVTLTVCGQPKELAPSFSPSWPTTTAELSGALARWGTHLSPLADCH